MWPFQRNQSTDAAGDIVHDGVSAWRAAALDAEAAGRARLAPAARARIIEAAGNGHGIAAPLPMLFPPGRRLALAATLPVLLGAALLLLVREPAEGHGSAALVRAYKDADRVVFLIANGKRNHHVYRSTVADSFDEASGEKVAGSFADDVNGSSPLVFYRIE